MRVIEGGNCLGKKRAHENYRHTPKSLRQDSNRHRRPLPVTENKKKYILTVQDCLTKYSDAIPLKTIDSVAIAVTLAENIICRFGCPQIIHTDQGSNFLSRIMKVFCRIFQIKQIKSTAFHPQSLGGLERSHHVFVEYLRHSCSKYNWDQWLKFAMFS